MQLRAELLLVHGPGVASLAGDLRGARRAAGSPCSDRGRSAPSSTPRSDGSSSQRAPFRPCVDVVGAVTGETVRAELLLVEVARVAGRAGQLLVRADERVVRVARVVEAHLRPAGGGVARLALRAEAALVLVVEHVAGRAVARRVLVALARVAQRAGHLRVLALEREAGLRVVEVGLPPGRLLVAVRAVAAQSPLVRVVARVAVDAARARVAELLARRVARLARQARVRPVQRVVGLVVAERVAVQAHDVGVAAEVVAVADLAVRARDRGRAAVEARLRAHVEPRRPCGSRGRAGSAPRP